MPTLEDHIKALSKSASSTITEDQVRGTVKDNLRACGALDPGYEFTTLAIAQAMVNACADFNAIEPAVVAFNPSVIPNLGFMVDGILYHMYQGLLHEEQSLDVGSAGGSVTNDAAARRVAHYTSNLNRFNSRFQTGALAYKQQRNRNMGWRRIG